MGLMSRQGCENLPIKQVLSLNNDNVEQYTTVQFVYSFPQDVPL